MDEKLQPFITYVFSETEALLFDTPSACLSTEAFVAISRQEIIQKTYTEQTLYQAIFAGLEQQLPIIMSRSLQRIDITPQEVWTDILDDVFADRVLIAWRRQLLTDHMYIVVAEKSYLITLDDPGPTTLLEEIVFPQDPIPTLVSANPWPTKG